MGRQLPLLGQDPRVRSAGAGQHDFTLSRDSTVKETRVCRLPGLISPETEYVSHLKTVQYRTHAMGWGP